MLVSVYVEPKSQGNAISMQWWSMFSLESDAVCCSCRKFGASYKHPNKLEWLI